MRGFGTVSVGSVDIAGLVVDWTGGVVDRVGGVERCSVSNKALNHSSR